MNIKALSKEEYFMYINTTGHIARDYFSMYWVLVIFTSILCLDIFINGLLIGSIIALGIFAGLLMFNLITFSAKMNHVKKQHNIDKGFSLLK